MSESGLPYFPKHHDVRIKPLQHPSFSDMHDMFWDMVQQRIASGEAIEENSREVIGAALINEFTLNVEKHNLVSLELQVLRGAALTTREEHQVRSSIQEYSDIIPECEHDDDVFTLTLEDDWLVRGNFVGFDLRPVNLVDGEGIQRHLPVSLGLVLENPYTYEAYSVHGEDHRLAVQYVGDWAVTLLDDSDICYVVG